MLSPIANLRFSDLPRIVFDVFKNQMTTVVANIAAATFSSQSYASKHPFKAGALVIGVSITVIALATIALKLAKLRGWKSDVFCEGPKAPKAEEPKPASAPEALAPKAEEPKPTLALETPAPKTESLKSALSTPLSSAQEEASKGTLTSREMEQMSVLQIVAN